MANKKRIVLWIDGKTGKLAMADKTFKLVLCNICPCECEPGVIGSAITNYDHPKWNLRRYQGDGVGRPGGRWRIRDVGESHHNSPNAYCSGTIYSSGKIDKNGKLVGLPNEFVSRYSYNGYMELQQGCVQPDGSVLWPCPN